MTSECVKHMVALASRNIHFRDVFHLDPSLRMRFKVPSTLAAAHLALPLEEEHMDHLRKRIARLQLCELESNCMQTQATVISRTRGMVGQMGAADLISLEQPHPGRVLGLVNSTVHFFKNVAGIRSSAWSDDHRRG